MCSQYCGVRVDKGILHMAEQEEGCGVGRDDKRCESIYPSIPVSQYEQHIVTVITADLK